MTDINELDENDFRPSPARLIESLRDTGYSEKAAFADIVDNSIAANAKKILIHLEFLMGEFRVVIVDNGSGMTEAQLKNAMRYGSEKRSNPKSLGKFGMGLKTASTAFCRRLVVLSHKNSEFFGRSWDLDTIKEKDRWELETPDENQYRDDFEFLKEFSESSGTMIIWEKIDRLIKPGSAKQIESEIEALGKELKNELNAIFYHYIKSNNIEISIQILNKTKDKLKGWDPLCCDLLTTSGQRSKILREKEIFVDYNGGKYSFTVKGSLIPSQNHLNAEEQEAVRYSLDNQGFYIYREGRLIWNDGWPHRIYKKESKITRLRIELQFNHELDDLFSIDFRKSRVIIPKEVRTKLQEIITPWRQELLKDNQTSTVDTPNVSPQRHDPANNAIDKHKENTQNFKINVDGDTVTIRNENQQKPAIVQNIRVYENKTVRVQEEDSLTADNLWEPSCDIDGNTCVSLGKSHPYFVRMYAVCKDNLEATKALDMLLWSLANAEHGEYSETNKHTLTGFRQKVSQSLRYLSLELPDEESE